MRLHTKLNGIPEDFSGVYATPDLMLSAFLKAEGLQLLDTKRDSGRVFFRFKDSPDRPKLIGRFFNNGSIGISDFKSHLNDLKILINRGA